MAKYVKLTAAQLETYGITQKGDSHEFRGINQIVAIVKKYYPTSAARGLIIVNSEYNDNTYDNTLGSVIVFDKEGNEITPRKGEEIVARREMADLEISMDSDEQLNDIPFFMKLPDLYVLADEI